MWIGTFLNEMVWATPRFLWGRHISVSYCRVWAEAAVVGSPGIDMVIHFPAEPPNPGWLGKDMLLRWSSSMNDGRRRKFWVMPSGHRDEEGCFFVKSPLHPSSSSSKMESVHHHRSHAPAIGNVFFPKKKEEKKKETYAEPLVGLLFLGGRKRWGQFLTSRKWEAMCVDDAGNLFSSSSSSFSSSVTGGKKTLLLTQNRMEKFFFYIKYFLPFWLLTPQANIL